MRPIGLNNLYTNCLMILGVSRSKLAVIFLIVMTVSVFLTFYELYDSNSFYNSKSSSLVVSGNRFTIITNHHVSETGHRMIKSVNQQTILSHNNLHFPKTSRKLPQALIIGVRKCGTRALLEMLYLHPRIQKAGGEVHFFDRDENYIKGLEWYRKKMPYSFRGQITIEKSPSYFVSSEVPERVRAMNASIKLLLIVRDPVTRAISDYTQLRSHATTSFSSLTNQNQQQTTQLQFKPHELYRTLKFSSFPSSPSLLAFQNNNNEKIFHHKYDIGSEILEPNNREISFMPQSTLSTSSTSKLFEDLAIFPNGSINESYRPLIISMYHLHVHRWLEVFPREQLLIVNGDQLIDDPVPQLKRIEKFLGIEHRINNNHFYFNETKGFYCLKYDNGDRCLRETKGRKHPHVDPIIISKLRKFFSEHNQKFYELVDEDLAWPEE